MVPEGWERVTYGEICTINRDNLPPSTAPDHKITYLDIGSIPDLGVIAEDLEEFNFSSAPSRARRVVRHDDVIVSTVRPYLQAFARIVDPPENLVASTGFAVLTPNGRVRSDFLFQTVCSHAFLAQLEARMVGSNYPAVNMADIAVTIVLLPPITEQRKIAAILSSLDDAIAGTRKVIEQTKRVKQGLLQRLMTRGIGHTRFKKTEIGEIPGAWEVKPALEVAHGGKAGIAGGPFGSDLTSKDYIDRPGVPVIRGTNLNYEDGTFRLDDFVFVSEEKADQLARNLAFPGDLIVTQRGTLGQVGLIPTESPFDRYVVSQSQMKLTPDRGMIHPRFLWYYATSETVLNWIESHTIATGVPHINLGLFRRLPVPVVPLEEQTKILAPLDALQDRIDAGVAEEESIHRLKRGLMQNLLTGRVRVKPD